MKDEKKIIVFHKDYNCINSFDNLFCIYQFNIFNTMKLFSIKVTGGELVGYKIFPVGRWNMAISQCIMDYGAGHYHIIGPLSDVTEDMAKEWGYKASFYHAHYTAHRKLESEIRKQLKKKGIKSGIKDLYDLSNILLILIKE